MHIGKVIGKYIGLVIFALFSLSAAVVWQARPISGENEIPEPVTLSVQTRVLKAEPFTVTAESYGAIRPKIQSILTAQITGEVIYLNPNVRDGGFFGKGDVLIEIDPSDYEANLRIANAALLDAEQGLAEAEARARQAEEDWGRLGDNGEPPPLALRLPQLNAARARLESAGAQLRKAELNLMRTRIVAPFDGRVLRKSIDIGQLASAGTPLVEVYATEAVEIRLPVRDRDLPYVLLPEPQANPDVSAGNEFPVEIRSDLNGSAAWRARLIRTESAIDAAARQLHVIAEIADPFGPEYSHQAPLKILQYVTAGIPGKTIDEAIVIPNSAIYQGSYVYVAADDLLQRRNVEIGWQDEEVSLIGSGLESGDELVLTLLGQVISGTPIARRESAPGAIEARPGGGAR